MLDEKILSPSLPLVPSGFTVFFQIICENVTILEALISYLHPMFVN